MALENEPQTGQNNGSTGSTGTNGASGNGSQTSNTAATGTQGSQTGQAGEQPRAGASNTGKFSYEEDRSKWIPPHRFNEVSQKAKDIETVRAEATVLRQQLQALTGATPADPKTKQTEEIKAAFYELFPHAKSLMELKPEQLQQLLSLPQQVESANSYANQGWQRHGKQQLANVVERVSEHIGGELSERAQGRLKSAFANMIENEGEKSKTQGQPTAILQKYLDGDDSLIEEFAKEWADDFITPARRQAVAGEVNRAKRVPNSTGRSQQTSVQRPESFKSLDDRLDYAANLYKERGGQFSR